MMVLLGGVAAILLMKGKGGEMAIMPNRVWLKVAQGGKRA
jgi:hypothetical protein